MYRNLKVHTWVPHARGFLGCMSSNADNASIAAFLITRPPIGIMGTRANSTAFSLQPGTPAGLCKKEGGGVYSREWTNGVARLDCGSFVGSLPFP